ncbi:MAG: RNA methyltransferase, partial [Gemmatimonadetes bacterium]|nr:RNA methyltransferase [Gemmatimonadota bacterium]
MPRPIVLVLVGTKSAGNLGSVCRIARAFDFAGVRLVNPQVAVTDDDARRLGRSAHDILDAAKTYATLPEALADCRRSGATTARPRHWSRPVRHPAEAMGPADGGDGAPYAVVFGPEDSGLRNEDLAVCDEILSIPLPDTTDSTLSLPASCAIVCHELSRSL